MRFVIKFRFSPKVADHSESSAKTAIKASGHRIIKSERVFPGKCLSGLVIKNTSTIYLIRMLEYYISRAETISHGVDHLNIESYRYSRTMEFSIANFAIDIMR